MALRTVNVTRAEYAVARELACDGPINRDIGERLGITEDTVKSHVKSLLSRTGCEQRTELAVKMARRVIELNPVTKTR